MSRIEIFGFSDDIIEVEGDVSLEFYAHFSFTQGVPNSWAGVVADSDGNSMVVEARFDVPERRGGWVLAPGKTPKGWAVKKQATSPHVEYSEGLEITCPGDVITVIQTHPKQ